MLFAFCNSIFGVLWAMCGQFPKLNLWLNVLDQTKGSRPSCTRVSILSHVDRRASCSGCAVGLRGLHSSILCIMRALKNVHQSCPSLRAILLRWSAGFARVLTCRIVLPTTLLQPTSLCHRTSSMRVEREHLLLFLRCNLILVFSGDLYPCPLPILIHAKMWIGHTKGRACCLSPGPVSSHSILARLDLPPLFLGSGPGSTLFSIPPIS